VFGAESLCRRIGNPRQGTFHWAIGRTGPAAE